MNVERETRPLSQRLAVFSTNVCDLISINQRDGETESEQLEGVALCGRRSVIFDRNGISALKARETLVGV